MADLRFQKDQYRHGKSRIRDSQAPLDKRLVAERLTHRASEIGLRQSDIAAAIGIPKTTMGRIWKGENLPDSATLFPLSDMLQVSPRWLLYGGDVASFADAPSSEWESLAIYDLASITASGKGTPLDMMPIRSDWLGKSLRDVDDLWLTEMPNDLLNESVGEGDMIVCKDIEPHEAELHDGRIYVLLLNEQPIIRRLSFETDALLLSTSDGRLPPIRIPRTDAAYIDQSIVPLARVLGALTLKTL